MASFESKVSDIFSENPRLGRKMPVVIRQLFHESESEFKRRIRNESEDVKQNAFLRLFDILFIDFFFDEINDWFLNWVINHYPERFTQAELDEMSAQATSHLDFYEVHEVTPSKGSHIKSLYTHKKGFLKDISSSSNLVKWDILLARCYLFSGYYYATGSLTVFGPPEKKFILEKIEKAHSEYINLFQDSEYAHFAKNRWDIFYQIEREIYEKARNKKFYTKYGELQLCEVRFQIRNLKYILEKIRSLDEFNFIEAKTQRDKKRKRTTTRYQFDWLTLGIEEELNTLMTKQHQNGIIFFTHQLDNKGNQTGIEVIGTLYIDKFMARLETRSIALAEFASHHFISLFGDALAFKRIIKKKMKSGVAGVGEKKQTETKKSIQPNTKMLKKIEEEWYMGQLDQKIPSLNNMTPREARHDPAMQPLLIEWLKGLENLLEHKRLDGEEVFSIKKIKKALDFDW